MKAKNQVSIFNVLTVIAAVYTVILVALKLLTIINWSWWWVFAPALFVVAVTIAIVVFVNLALKDDA